VETMQDTQPHACQGGDLVFIGYSSSTPKRSRAAAVWRRAKTLRRERNVADLWRADNDFGADTQVLLKKMVTMVRRASTHAGLREHKEPGTHEYEHLSSARYKGSSHSCAWPRGWRFRSRRNRRGGRVFRLHAG